MSEQWDIIKQEFDEAIKHARRFCFAARAKEFQLSALERLTSLGEGIIQLKDEMISSGNIDYANRLLSLEKMVESVANELKMWIALKSDNPNEAWNYLVAAQGAARIAIQAHEIAEIFTEHVDRLYALEKLLFPPQIFISPGFIIKRSVCSICGQDYDECEHVIGRVYMGQICTRIIVEADLLEISIVSEPSNKLARAVTITVDGIERDVMSWRPVSKQEQDALG